MTTDIKVLPFRDQAFLVALASIGERIRELPEDDREDIRELTKAFLASDSDEEQDSAAKAIIEIFDQAPARVRELKVPEDDGTLKKWTAYLAKRIRDLRIAAGMTQDRLAEKSGLGQSHICRLEKGQHSPNALTIEKIAAALGVPVSQIDPNALDDIGE